MSKSLKREQVELLRFEKQLLGLGSGLAALTAGAAASADEVVGGLAGEHADAVRTAYLNLVETVQAAHSAIESSAVGLGATLLQAGGQPKPEPPVLELAKSILGIG
jgi:hypothetical protein